jgi:hypothetical protein
MTRARHSVPPAVAVGPCFPPHPGPRTAHEQAGLRERHLVDAELEAAAESGMEDIQIQVRVCRHLHVCVCVCWSKWAHVFMFTHFPAESLWWTSACTITCGNPSPCCGRAGLPLDRRQGWAVPRLWGA